MASNTLQQRRPARDHNQPPLDPGREIQDSDHGMAQKQRLSPWRPWIADSRVYRRFSPKSSAICVAISVSMLLIMTGAGPSATGIYVENPSMITFAVGLEQKGTPLFRQLSDFDFNMDLKPDFGEIIHDLDSKRYEEYRSELLSDMNHERIRLEFYFDEELEYVEQKCRRVNWFSKTYPTCNAFHELPPVFDLRKEKDYKVTYLRYDFSHVKFNSYYTRLVTHALASSFSHYSSGYYRDAFRYEKHTDAEEFVLKPLRLKTKMIFNFRDFAMVQKEAVIMEQLSASPNILDMYGYCGTSVVLEAMAGVVDSKMMTGDGYASRKELDRLDDVYPANNLTAMEKLQIALEMAESLADIHGYKGGEIVHEDVYPEQWLVARDGAVKLNDFNNAGISLWDDATQTYCTRQAEYNGMVKSNLV